MLVSIITPSFNQAEYLEQTIQSVLTQDYSEIEYIIVDGGSTDGSPEIIKKYADQLHWWVSEPDQGQGEAINKGVGQASGDLIAWLNSDDLLAPGAVRAAVRVFEEHPDLGMVYGNAISIDRNGRPLNDMRFGNFTWEDFARFQIICQPAVFLRRQTFLSAGAIDPSYHFLLDHQLWLRVTSRFPTQHVPQVWAFARHHPGAKNVAQAAEFGQEAFRIVEWLRADPEYTKRNLDQDPRVLAGAHRFNARYLLDGGQPRAALGAYWKAVQMHPVTGLQEFPRIVFAGLSMVGFKGLGNLYYRIKARRLPRSMPGIENIKTLYNR